MASWAQRQAKSLVERRLNVQILRSLPHGFDPISDLARHGIPSDPADVTIVDVGANVGTTVAAFLAAYASAHVHAFEPAPDTFARLSSRFDDPRVALINAALSSSAGRSRLHNHVRHDLRALDPEGDVPVVVTTLDLYAREQGLERIDILKIDTEGHDLEVLRGATATLTTVTALQVEVSMNAGNTKHVHIETMLRELELHGFRIFGVYEQWMQQGTRYLRRANCVFIRNE
jgi:FkbM family methyltransferase